MSKTFKDIYPKSKITFKLLQDRLRYFHDKSKTFRTKHWDTIVNAEKDFFPRGSDGLIGETGSQAYPLGVSGLMDEHNRKINLGNKNYREMKKAENKKAFLATISNRDRMAIVSALVNKKGFKFESVAQDRLAAGYLNELKRDVDSRDKTFQKYLDLVTCAVTYNVAVRFFESAGVFANSKTFSYNSKIVDARFLLLDPNANVDDIQTSTFIGRDDRTVTGQNIRAIFDDKDAIQEIKKNQRLLELVTNDVKTIEEKKREKHKVIDFLLHIPEDDCVYQLLALKEEAHIIDVRKYSKVTVGGREIRFNAECVVINHDRGFYSESLMSQYSPRARIEAEAFTNLIEVISEASVNRLIVDPTSFQEFITAEMNNSRFIQASPTTYDGRPSFAQKPSSDLGGVSTTMAQLIPNIQKVNPIQLEGIAQSERQLRGVQSEGATIGNAIIDNAAIPVMEAKKDGMMIFVKLLFLYGSDELLIRSTGLGVSFLQKLLFSNMVGKKEDGVNSIAIDLAVDDEKTINTAVENREKIAHLRSCQSLDPAKVDIQVLRMNDYDDIDVLNLKLPYEEMTIRKAYNDAQSVLLGNKVVPSVMVSRGYVETLKYILDMMQDVVTFGRNKYTEQGGNLLTLFELAVEKYRENIANPTVSFERQETQDATAELNANERLNEIQQNAGGNDNATKSLFANQTSADKDNNPNPVPTY